MGKDTIGKMWIKSEYWNKVGNRNWGFKTDNYELYNRYRFEDESVLVTLLA